VGADETGATSDEDVHGTSIENSFSGLIKAGMEKTLAADYL
jgi:hypothetical protein